MGRQMLFKQHRQSVMSAAFEACPERFRAGLPVVKGAPTAVYINPPKHRRILLNLFHEVVSKSLTHTEMRLAAKQIELKLTSKEDVTDFINEKIFEADRYRRQAIEKHMLSRGQENKEVAKLCQAAISSALEAAIHVSIKEKKEPDPLNLPIEVESFFNTMGYMSEIDALANALKVIGEVAKYCQGVGYDVKYRHSLID